MIFLLIFIESSANVIHKRFNTNPSVSTWRVLQTQKNKNREKTLGQQFSETSRAGYENVISDPEILKIFL